MLKVLGQTEFDRLVFYKKVGISGLRILNLFIFVNELLVPLIRGIIFIELI